MRGREGEREGGRGGGGREGGGRERGRERERKGGRDGGRGRKRGRLREIFTSILSPSCATGKTYTMCGPPGSYQARGIIPRAIGQVPIRTLSHTHMYNVHVDECLASSPGSPPRGCNYCEL